MVEEAPKWLKSKNIIAVEDTEHELRPESLLLGLKESASEEEKENFEREMNRKIGAVARVVFPELKEPYYTWSGEVVERSSLPPDKVVPEVRGDGIERYRARRKTRVAERAKEKYRLRKQQRIDAKNNGDGVGRAMRPVNTDYDYSEDDTTQDFARKNTRKLKTIYEQGGVDAVNEEWNKFRLANSTKNLHEIEKDAADDVMRKNVRQNAYDGWANGTDTSHKEELVSAVTRNPETRNAALNIAYANYKGVVNNPLPFEKFLITPVKVYLGETGRKGDVFDLAAFSKKGAEYSAGPDGNVIEAEVRPIDTYGSIRVAGEDGIWVPKQISPVEHAREQRNDGLSWEWYNPVKWVFEDYKDEPVEDGRIDLLDSIVREAEMIKLFADDGEETGQKILGRCIDSIQRLVLQLTASRKQGANEDSAFFQGELNGKLGEREVLYPGTDSDPSDNNRRVAQERADADEEEGNNGGNKGGGGHGNTRIPFGLCQKEGIDVGSDWTPKDAWDALKGKGYSANEVYKHLKETGSVNGSKTRAAKMSTADAERISKTYSDAQKRYKEAKENLRNAESRVEDAKRTIEHYEEGYIPDAEGKAKEAKAEYERIKSGKTRDELNAEKEKTYNKALSEIVRLNYLRGKPPSEDGLDRKWWEKTILDNAEGVMGIKRPEAGTEDEREWKRLMLGTCSYEIGQSVAKKLSETVNEKIDKCTKIDNELKAMDALDEANSKLENVKKKKDEAREELRRHQADAENYRSSVEKDERTLEEGAEEWKSAVNAKFPSYDDCQTIEDIEEKLRANGCVSNENTVDLSEMHMDAAKLSAKAIDDFYQKIPSMRRLLGDVSARRMAYGTYAGSLSGTFGDKVLLNTEMFENLETLKSGFQRDVDKKFHPDGVGVDAILHHELAHKMDSYLTRTLRDNAKGDDRINISTSVLNEVSEKLGMKPDDIKLAVSGYATKRSAGDWHYGQPELNLQTMGYFDGRDLEFFAEAISEYMSSPKPRQIAVEAWNATQKYLRQAEERGKRGG